MSLGLFLAMSLTQAPGQTGLPSKPPTSAWEDAVACLKDPKQSQKAIGHFREAACGWEYLRRLNDDCVHYFLWLGYSYQAAGDLPHAIVAYRAGLALDEPDSDTETAKLRFALAHAREQVRYPPARGLAQLLRPERDFWPPWLSLHFLSAPAFGLYFAAWLAATRWWMTRRRRWLVAAGTLLAAAAVPAIGSLVEWQHERRDSAEPIVVMARDVPLRAGNGPDYPPKLEMPRGCEVRQLFDRGGWLQVETGGGTVGWVPADAVVGR